MFVTYILAGEAAETREVVHSCAIDTRLFGDRQRWASVYTARHGSGADPGVV